MYIHPESSQVSTHFVPVFSEVPPATVMRIHTPLLRAFCYLCTVHDQRVNDPIASLPTAHSLHAAVVVSQCEMGFCAIVHKLPLQV